MAAALLSSVLLWAVIARKLNTIEDIKLENPLLIWNHIIEDKYIALNSTRVQTTFLQFVVNFKSAFKFSVVMCIVIL
ncbi:hypothetical protein A3755_24850 [Oleiphilus sp. HI0085]|nr:hypothetical protein A3732_06280 [Oleiphilus sp. HI0050]KZY79081.1 hypothetical protein A3741_07515 [Oleiphilus sp. HI0069]KZZ39906.1 hypothetical protein A3755_24850 [Oleiphilus sp. HI0085]KZZ52752.1 hypothetical protein A3761_19025 [Oleiphilus sp. HI0123]